MCIPRKPWYVMLYLQSVSGYDPVVNKWYDLKFKIPLTKPSRCYPASSEGLVCFMDEIGMPKPYIFNPIIRTGKSLVEPPAPMDMDVHNCAIALFVNRETYDYNVYVVTSRKVDGDYLKRQVDFHAYDSKTESWTSVTEIFSGWTIEEVSIVCDKVLHVMIFSIGLRGELTCHGVITHDCKRAATQDVLMENCIPVPCYLTCGCLLNLREKLVLVGEVVLPDYEMMYLRIRGFGIWMLNNNREWEKIG